MGEPALVLEEVAPTDAEADALLAALDAELIVDYPPAHVFGFHPGERERFHGVFLVARLDGMPVGCGGVRWLDAEMAEVKRMYVAPEARGRGVAQAILAALEAAARARGLRVLRLETGTRLYAAQRLYEAAGFARIPCFGEYEGEPFSLCYEKRLDAAPLSAAP
ncbi:MAG TPA: GNAT family N-acetyltransferase [Rubricoccaceae bacterium]|nr:GNAT family N-acetyltransferase [Rubricoccaceae bacterium]